MTRYCATFSNGDQISKNRAVTKCWIVARDLYPAYLGYELRWSANDSIEYRHGGDVPEWTESHIGIEATA